MNRFDYFSDIEDEFIRQRGRALILSPLDWELIEQWKDAGMPLHVVIHAIGDVFTNRKAKERRRPIATLSYCKSEVEAQFKEWKAGRVGAHESEPGAVATGSKSPFPKDEVMTYLRATQEQLFMLSDAPDGLKITILHVAEKLEGLARDLYDAERVNAPQLEACLTTLETILACAIEMVATPEQLAEARFGAEALFSPYKNKMPEKVYDQQIGNELKKRLRAIFGVPRLSLFHMKGF